MNTNSVLMTIALILVIVVLILFLLGGIPARV